MDDFRKVLNLLSLAQRSGKLVCGGFMTERAIKDGHARLVVIAADASENTKKKFQNMCTFYRTPVIELSDMETIGHSIGRSERSSLAIMDGGLSKAVLKQLEACGLNTRR